MISEVRSKTTTRFDKIVLQISKIITVISVIVLVAMTVIILMDVIGRYFFDHPLPGANELTGILLIPVATWGIGYCQLLKRNIRIDMIYARFNPKNQSVLNIISYLAFLFASVIITWQMYVRMIEYLNDHGITEILGLPFWPFMLMAVIGFGWGSFVYFVEICNSIKVIARR
jgi:TRAP-type C4-dicarboxylate transport system permease small subunit